VVTPLSAPQTLERARALFASGRGAALPELLKLIETLSLDVSAVTISELAELIEKDAVILEKVLSVANMLANNPGAAPLSTLSQAIHRLGYNRIRTLAVSLMLLETSGSGCPPEQREAATQALCAGLIAQGAAEELGTHDSELVFACAALRGFGRIVMAAIAPELTREALKLTPPLSLSAAFRQCYGLTPLELSQRVLSSSRLPEEVKRTFRECEPETLHGVSSTYDARLLGITDFGCRLSELALAAHEGEDAFADKSAALARRFGRLIPGAETITSSVLARADHRLTSFSRCQGSRALPAQSLSRLHHRAASKPALELLPAEPDAETLRGADAAPGTGTDLAPSGTAVPPTSDAGVTETLPLPLDFDALDTAGPEHPSTDDPLAAIRQALKADACWLFQRAPGATTLRHSGLDPAGSLSSLAVVRDGERTVFGVCLSRREVVVLHDTREPTILRYLPSWWDAIVNAPLAFALIPLTEGGQVTTLVMAGWQAPRRVTLADTDVAFIQECGRRAQKSPAFTRGA
jgi:HD-like signal output (HDOD) protein